MAEAQLVVREGNDAGREVAVESALTVGRGEDADLVLSDSGISRKHAKLSAQGGAVVIEDLGSSNGTFVNGERVEGSRVLRDGDEIHLGGALLAFVQGTGETQVLMSDPDATSPHGGPAPVPPPTQPAQPPAPPPPPAATTPPPPPVAPPPAHPPPEPVPVPQPRAHQEPPPPPRREPLPQVQPDAPAAKDGVNDWNIPALLSFVLGPLSIALLIFSSGSGFYAALPVAVAGIALGTIGRSKVDRGESTRYRSLASAGRTFSIVGTVLASIILVALIAITQFLDVSAENLDELIDEVKSEIENRTG